MLPQNAYTVPTRIPESKKPGRSDRAKCLISLVGRDRFELSTYGLRVGFCHGDRGHDGGGMWKRAMFPAVVELICG